MILNVMLKTKKEKWNIKNRMDFVLILPPQLLLYIQHNITISPHVALEMWLSLKANLLSFANNPVGVDV